jgi:NNP family nitrate/nitrite transporter-like MFS transporter
MIPKMDITTTGPGVLATKKGKITAVSPTNVKIDTKDFAVNHKVEKPIENSIFPTKNSWQEVVVTQNQEVKKKDLLAKGITTIHFDANMWVYLILVILIGISWGIGKAAVYKHIPEYFPTEVGVVGGMVGMIGGLGGFFGPIIFSYLLTSTGIWSSSWMFILLFSAICLIWMHLTVTKIMNEKQPDLSKVMERESSKK